ncbi:MAG: hypothetical protein HYS27_13990 [Deltaproteobacteria bacterium]|nr:hypothetical protein [Deltaproteobacteria bacterium]
MITRGAPLVPVLVLLAAAGCAHLDAPATDATLDGLERAYATLRAGGSHARARLDLEHATASFEELALPGTSLEEALASDPAKPYRGRPWERTLSLVLLAALDAERGRCDLAVPALKSAALHDLRAARGEVSDAPIVYLLLLRCLHDVGAPAGDVERARADLGRSLAQDGSTVGVEELERAVLAPALLLAFDGEGPTLEQAGRFGESALVHADDSAASRPQVARARPERGAVLLRLGRPAPRSLPADADGIALWASAKQASSIGGRPFDEVLRERAELKGDTQRAGERLFGDGLGRARTPGALVGGLATAAAGAGLYAAGAVVDARADARFVPSLFGRVLVLVGGQVSPASSPLDGGAVAWRDRGKRKRAIHAP